MDDDPGTRSQQGFHFVITSLTTECASVCLPTSLSLFLSLSVFVCMCDSELTNDLLTTCVSTADVLATSCGFRLVTI